MEKAREISPFIMAIGKILKGIEVEEFIDRYYLKLPYSQPSGAEEYAGLASWEVLEKILAKPEPDVLAVREGERWKEERLPTYPEARALFEQGYTLLVRNAERHDRGLQKLARSFKKDFRAPINVHLYFTPGESFGFDWHYDAEEVFILQSQGSKEYSLRKNTVNPWPLEETLPRDMQFEREVMPILNCLLHPGDWLYLPSGYWHKAQAKEDSISLAIGVMAPSAMKIYDFLKKHLLSSLLWRQRLPLFGELEGANRTEVVTTFRALFADLGEEVSRLLRDEGLVREFMAREERWLESQETKVG